MLVSYSCVLAFSMLQASIMRTLLPDNLLLEQPAASRRNVRRLGNLSVGYHSPRPEIFRLDVARER